MYQVLRHQRTNERESCARIYRGVSCLFVGNMSRVPYKAASDVSWARNRACNRARVRIFRTSSRCNLVSRMPSQVASLVVFFNRRNVSEVCRTSYKVTSASYSRYSVDAVVISRVFPRSTRIRVVYTSVCVCVSSRRWRTATIWRRLTLALVNRFVYRRLYSRDLIILFS